MKFKALIASATAALMTACGSVDVDQYAKETPKLELSSFSLERLMPGEFSKTQWRSCASFSRRDPDQLDQSFRRHPR